MGRPKMRRMSAMVAAWARRDRAFADLISRHPEVAERLDAICCFRDAKTRMTVHDAAEAAGYPLSTLYSWDTQYDGDPASLANLSRARKTLPERLARTPEITARIRELRKASPMGANGICDILLEEGWEISSSSVGRIIEELLKSGEIEPLVIRKGSAPGKSKKKRP